MLYLGNAFSPSMLPDTPGGVSVHFAELNLGKVKELLNNGNFVSAVGHQSTADFISMLVGVSVPANRTSIKLQYGDELLVLQLMSRLPEGVVLSKEEVEKVPHKWYLVRLLPPYTLEAVYHW